MSNSYFQFKQFRIEQDKCAMKVTTDACIQGAWTPVFTSVHDVLDVGAGSGLLSLMLAQRVDRICIDAIEYDEDAATQARENVEVSPWHGRIKVIHGDAASYAFGRKYNLIICNPPFFINSLLSDKDSKNKARHTVSFTHADLLRIANDCLNSGGYLSILLPAEEYMLWKELAGKQGWYEFSSLSIKHTVGSPVKRVVGLFAKEQLRGDVCTLHIKDEAGNYSADFISLLSPFYLAL